MYEEVGNLHIFSRKDNGDLDLEKIEGNEERIRQYREDLIDIVDYILKHNRDFIGEGMTAKVFSCPFSPNVCIKVVDESTISPLYEFKGMNSLKEEGEFLYSVSRLNRGKTKVPIPIATFSIRNQDENKSPTQILLMETLDAVTVASVLDGDKDLPENFKFDSFMNELRVFIKNMHDLGVFHRDLHGGNIMIDKTTGDPRIIDFGIGIMGSINDDAIYRVERPDNSVGRIPTDDQRVEELNRMFRKSRLLTN